MVGAGPHHTCHVSDRLGSPVKATPCATLPAAAQHSTAQRARTHARRLPYRWCVSPPPLTLASLSQPLSPVQDPFFICVSPLTHKDDPCQRLAMMMSPAAALGSPRQGSFCAAAASPAVAQKHRKEAADAAKQNRLATIGAFD